MNKVRRFFASIFGISLVACISAGCTLKQAAEQEAQVSKHRDFLPGVRIIYSANVDGEIEPCGCRTNPTGGIDRRFNLIHQRFLGEALSLDSGDAFYQSFPVPPFLEKQWNYQASVLVKAYNAFGVEVMSPGELEFADGLVQFLRLAQGAKFKIVSANLYKKGTAERLLSPYVILNKGGRKVAVFGLYDEALPLPPELEARDHVSVAKEMVKELRRQADVVLALTHEGLEKDESLAREVPEIDAIFGAHTQSFLPQPEKIGETLIFQTSFRGQHIGEYYNGENGLYQVDARFDSKAGEQTEVDRLLAGAKAEIARINKEGEQELMGGSAAASFSSKKKEFQTFPRCLECHAVQHDFHKKTPHFRAFETLVKAKQSANLDCLKCHTVGFQQEGGWKSVNKLVLNAKDRPIDAENFAKSAAQMKLPQLAKISKAFINVQCENCHGAAQEHPFSGGKFKEVTTSTCMQCHTPDRAPEWYKDGKPNQAVIQAKFKSMSCPVSKKE